MNNSVVKKNINELKFKYKNEHKNYEYNKCEITLRKDFNQVYVCVYEIWGGELSNYTQPFNKLNIDYKEVFYIYKF